MAFRELLIPLSAIITVSPALASQDVQARGGGAPPAPAYARYCLRVDPVTGSRLETIRCETREGWTELGVDLDQEWAEWGVRIIAPIPPGR